MNIVAESRVTMEVVNNHSTALDSRGRFSSSKLGVDISFLDKPFGAVLVAEGAIWQAPNYLKVPYPPY